MSYFKKPLKGDEIEEYLLGVKIIACTDPKTSYS